MQDALQDGRRFRVLTALDRYRRERLALDIADCFPSLAVTQVLARVIAARRMPDSLRIEDGCELTNNDFDTWACQHGIQVDFTCLSRPVENAGIESLNGKVRDKCLNTTWFCSLDQAKQVLQDWRRDYNEARPHFSLAK